jgi:hypothetical protein
MGKNSPNLVTLLLPSSPAAIFSSRCQKNTKSNWCRYVSAMALWPSYPLLELRILGTNATLSASNEPLVAQLKSVENIVLFCHVCFTAHSFVLPQFLLFAPIKFEILNLIQIGSAPHHLANLPIYTVSMCVFLINNGLVLISLLNCQDWIKVIKQIILAIISTKHKKLPRSGNSWIFTRVHFLLRRYFSKSRRNKSINP